MIHHEDDWLTIHGGDAREILPALPAESVHCVVTSPPYWGLRDYGTATWIGGDENCQHSVGGQVQDTKWEGAITSGQRPGVDASRCRKCGATRQDSQLGLEATPEEYVANLVGVFREVRRVLRADGTVWLNLGDSYNAYNGGAGPSSSISAGASTTERPRLETGFGLRTKGLKPKDLVGIPWRVAFALQADGWWLRSDIIWSKPNPMPESVTDRPTKAHEYLFLLSKSARYYYDADAVREAHADGGAWIGRAPVVDLKTNGDRNDGGAPPTTANPNGRNLRSVWTIATRPYPGAHFAVFPPELPERCIKAGTSEGGVCPSCGAPWWRVIEPTGVQNHRERRPAGEPEGMGASGIRSLSGSTYQRTTIATGWKASCSCERDGGGWATSVPATVLDPFAGSGTVGLVANRLSRRAILIDLNPEYLRQQMKRNAQVPAGL